VLVGVLILLLPTFAHAEVMDKEPTPSLLWAWAMSGGARGASA
jgi:hypothetical protein